LQRADRTPLRMAASRHQLLVQADEARGAAGHRAEVRGLADRCGVDRQGEESRLRHSADRSRLLPARARHVAPVVIRRDRQDFSRALEALSGDAPEGTAANYRRGARSIVIVVTRLLAP